MARRNRDYAAEYRRRIERAKAKAAAKGETFDLSKARGHTSKVVERQRARERQSGKFSERTLEKLHRRMLAHDHAMDRLLSAQDDGLTIGEIEHLIDLQNEAYEMYQNGADIETVRAKAFQAGAVAYDYGTDDATWVFYH